MKQNTDGSLRLWAVVIVIIITIFFFLCTPHVASKSVEVKPQVALAQSVQVAAPTEKKIALEEKPKQTVSVSIDTSALPQVMRDIAWAESSDRQFDKNGNCLIGVQTKDIGRWQINPIHIPEATKLGIDLCTERGNMEFALILYNRSGTTPWNSSKACWSNIEACKQKRGANITN